MATFLDAILAFPTVVFTGLIGLFLLYGIATLLGAFELEWLDSALGIDHASDSVLEGALNFLGVAGIPITIFAGVAAIFGWMSSIAGDKLLPDSLPVDLAVLAGSGLVGLAIGGVAVRPLRSVFNTPPAATRKAIVGKICTVRSLKVDDSFGTAEVEDGGAGFIAEVRCFRENSLTRDSKAIIYDYDQDKGVYHVGPLDPSIATADLTGRTTTAQRELA